MSYARAADLLSDLAKGIAPPQRRRVSESAATVVRLQSASGAIMPWSADITPYMRDPMNTLETRGKQALVFIGPAQSGKTQALIDCWIGHVVTCSPSDMMVIQATQSVARDFERDRWRKLKRYSPEIAAQISTHGHDDNTYDKTLVTGDTIYLKWPSENELQGKSLRRLALTDYDRMPLSIGGQGSPFDLARKRTRKYRSLGMTLVESSPGHEQSDPHWRPATLHQAPPSQGIFSLYNLGDRRRLYWPCPHCGEYFLSPPGPEPFLYEAQTDLLGAVMPETLGEVHIACPHCGGLIGERQRPAMLTASRWVPDGCRIDAHGRLDGAPPITDIASYWLHGVHAAFVTWRQLILGYLQALSIWQATGNEESLRTVIMQDFGAPYLPRSRQASLKPSELQARREHHTHATVAPEIRYLTAAVDVQAHYFSVMIVGHGPDRERWIVDRYEIHQSARPTTGGFERLDPAAYTEDWDQLTARVICAAYPLARAPHRRMNVRLTLVDTGGKHHKDSPEIGTTRRAYDWYRRLRTQGLAHRVALVKGRYQRPDTTGRTVVESHPDNTQRQDRNSTARGDIPLYMLHVNALKDALDTDLKRTEPGPGFIHLPDWLPSSFFDELTSEVRTASGWEPASGQRRNEAWDQLTYDLAGGLLPQDSRGLVSIASPAIQSARQADRIDWTKPPLWAGPHETNSEIDAPLSPLNPQRPFDPSASAARFRIG